MSVFESSFDYFEAYVALSFPDYLEMIPASGFEPAIDGQGIDQQGLVDALEFDPFAWVVGLDQGGTDPMTLGAPFAPDPTEVIPVLPAGSGDEFHGGLGGSPADRWLTGNEWHGSLSSGTVDPTGQGNDVFAVGGHVLSLPTRTGASHPSCPTFCLRTAPSC
jgi:hypothetical protein